MIFAQGLFAEGIFAAPHWRKMCHPGIDLVGRYVPDVALVGSHITALPLTTTVKLSPELEPELVLVGSYVPTLEMVGDTLYEDD